jgi:hypothetical protein
MINKILKVLSVFIHELGLSQIFREGLYQIKHPH